MKRIIVFQIVTLYLCLLPLAFVYSRSSVDTCQKDIEDIFEVHKFKYRYEAVRFLHQESKKKGSYIYIMSKESWNQYFALITGSPVDFEEDKDSRVNPGEVVNVKRISEEEMNKYIKRLNCTPEKALEEYRDVIQKIKSEKDSYLKRIDAELAKGDLSEYAKGYILPYAFSPPGQSVIGLPYLTRLDFLKVFKEFILDKNEEVLPERLYNTSSPVKIGEEVHPKIK